MLLFLACAHPPVPPPAAEAAPTSPTDPAWIDEGGLAELLTNPTDAPLVVNFWATWCGPCVRELPLFSKLATAHPGVQFLLVSVDSDRDHGRLLPFLTQSAVFLPARHLRAEDPSAALGRVVPRWPDIIPVTLVLDPGGHERARFEGSVDALALGAVLADDSPALDRAGPR